LGISIKLAPDVRVRASSRGVRTSLGSRAARLHVGGGRTAFSSGLGPVSMSGTLSARRRGAPARRTGSARAATDKAVSAMVENADEARAGYGAAEVDGYARTVKRLFLAVIAGSAVSLFVPVLVFVPIVLLVCVIVAASREVRRRRAIDRRRAHPRARGSRPSGMIAASRTRSPSAGVGGPGRQERT
jgi:hypothetical protein